MASRSSSNSLDAEMQLELHGVDITDTSSKVVGIVGANCIFMTLITITLAMRLYSKLWISRKFEKDDAAAIIGTAGALALSSVGLAMLQIGYGQHLWLGGFTTMVPRSGLIIQRLMVCAILHSFSLTLAKTSIIILYNRIFDSTLWFRRSMTFILTLCWFMFFITIFITIFQCRPIDAAWDFNKIYLHHSSCLDYRPFLYVGTGFTIATDLLLILLPVIPIMRMTLDRRRKIAVCLLFFVGFFACIASIIRMISLGALKNMDMPFTSVPAYIWSVVEVDVALICASCPAIRTIFNQHRVPFLSRIFLCDIDDHSSSDTEKPRNGRLDSYSYNVSPTTLVNVNQTIGGGSGSRKSKISKNTSSGGTLGRSTRGRESNANMHPYEAGFVDLEMGVDEDYEIVSEPRGSASTRGATREARGSEGSKAGKLKGEKVGG